MTFLTATMLRDAAISFPMLGDWSIDPPYSFTVFGFEISFYGAIIALGFILAALFCAKQAAKFGLTSDDLFDFVIWLIPTCIIGARLYYVLFKLDYFLANPSEILSLRDGGLAIYGGIIAGVITGVLVCKRKKIPVLALGDLAAFGLLIGQAIGRWGNFINVEAYGGETTLPWRMGITYMVNGSVMSEKFVHPTFLYESLWNLCVITVILILYRKKKFDGQMSATYFIGYGIGSPAAVNEPGWTTEKGVCVPESAPGIYTMTAQAGLEGSTTLGQRFRVSGWSGKFFRNRGWDGLGAFTLAPGAEAFFSIAGDGNIEIASGVTLEEGATYRLTLDVTAGKDNPVLSLVKK